MWERALTVIENECVTLNIGQRRVLTEHFLVPGQHSGNLPLRLTGICDSPDSRLTYVSQRGFSNGILDRYSTK